MSLNQVLMIGNAGADAELQYMPSGDPVARFRMAVSQSRLVDGEWQTTNTEWFSVSSFGQSAERIANTVKRGNRVFVEGRLSSNPYRTEGGEIRAGLNIRAFRVINLSQGGDDGGYGSYGGGDNFRAVPQDGGGSAPASGAQAGAGAGAGAAAGGGQAGGSGGDYSDNFDEGEDLPW